MHAFHNRSCGIIITKMSEHQRTFLKDLPPLIKRYTYHGESQFLDILQSESARLEASTDTSEYLLFHASKETIEDIFAPQNQDTSPVARLCSSFDTNEQLLLASMRTLPHGLAAAQINKSILQALMPMGLYNALEDYADVTIKGKDRGKQADHSWEPVRGVPGRRGAPSVALEVAFAESESKLTSDVRFWLSPEDGNANMCLTLRIGRSRPEIRLESWERRTDSTGIHRSQVTWITKRGNRVDINHHPFTIPFETLFCRPPSCPREKDIEISAGQLEQLAEAVWRRQGW